MSSDKHNDVFFTKNHKKKTQHYLNINDFYRAINHAGNFFVDNQKSRTGVKKLIEKHRFNIIQNEAMTATLSSAILTNDNSTLNILFDEDVYNSSESSGDLEVSDFSLSISGGNATLTSSTPISISKNTQSDWISTNSLNITLGISLTGKPDGNKYIAVNPSTSTAINDCGDTAITTDVMTIGVRLNSDPITAASMTTTGTTIAGSLGVDNVVMDSNNIGHGSDTDLMTLSSGLLTDAGDISITSDARLKSNIVPLGSTLENLLKLDSDLLSLSNGSITIAGEVEAISDIRLKSNIVSLDPTLLELSRIQPKRYTLIDDKDHVKKIGFLAQEVKDIFPELVTSQTNHLAVNY